MLMKTYEAWRAELWKVLKGSLVCKVRQRFPSVSRLCSSQFPIAVVSSRRGKEVRGDWDIVAKLISGGKEVATEFEQVRS
jgi:hypothetical protein